MSKRQCEKYADIGINIKGANVQPTTTTIDLDRLEALAKDTEIGGSPMQAMKLMRDFQAAANPAAILELIAAHRAAMAAKGQQEPFGYWIVEGDDLPYPGAGFVRNLADGRSYRSVTPLYAAPFAQQSEAGAQVADLKTVRAIAFGEAARYVEDLTAEGEILTFNVIAEGIRALAEAPIPTEAGAPTAAVFPTFEDWLASDITPPAPGLLPNQRIIEYARLAFNAARESAAPEAKQDAKDAARYQILRRSVWPADVRIQMKWVPPAHQTNEERIDMLCDQEIAAMQKG